jgi:hypothetical protein
MTTRTRIRATLAALTLTLGALLATTTPAPADPATTPTAFTITGVDLHDTTMKRFGDTYYLYGSMYACGYQWYISDTPWCGFGVSTAPTPQGPWSQPQLLFDPNSWDPWSKRSWQETCGGTGQGCFNVRAFQRTGWGPNDDVTVIWFNAPRHYSDTHANAYNGMGCAGPAGPCGPGVTPNGSYNKPSLSVCSGNGDFGMIERPATRPAIVCTMPGAAALNIEELNYSGSGGTGIGVRKVAGMDHVEGPGGYWDPEQQRYVLTYSAEGCGYCAGTPIGYATSPSLYSGWTAPGNVGWGAPAYARRTFSTSSCGGQPRTVTVLDGQPWQIIDLWLGTRNEAAADTHLVPLAYTPTPGVPGDGQIWRPPLTLDC